MSRNLEQKRSYNLRRYHELVARGHCVSCPGLAEPGYTKCKACRLRQAKRDAKKRNEMYQILKKLPHRERSAVLRFARNVRSLDELREAIRKASFFIMLDKMAEDVRAAQKSKEKKSR